MLDSEFISSVTFTAGDRRAADVGGISSLTDIHTYELPEKPVYSVDLGYTGADFRITQIFSNGRCKK